jgi:uncharacterized protein (DUF427 family)
MKAIWNDKIIAESENTIEIEGNHYFPTDTIKKDYFTLSKTQTTCPWKGKASYYNIIVNNKLNKDAAWYYPEPFDKAKQIKNHVAFWKGVQITK